MKNGEFDVDIISQAISGYVEKTEEDLIARKLLEEANQVNGTRNIPTILT